MKSYVVRWNGLVYRRTGFFFSTLSTDIQLRMLYSVENRLLSQVAVVNGEMPKAHLQKTWKQVQPDGPHNTLIM